MDKRPPLTIPRPVELAGMRSRLLRAQGQQKAIAKTGEEYDAVMDGIDEAHGAIKGHVGDLRIVESSLRYTIESMVERSNGAPTDGESDGRQLSSGQGEQTKEADEAKEPIVEITAETSDVKSAEVGTVEEVLAPVAETQAVIAEPAASWGAKPVV